MQFDRESVLFQRFSKKRQQYIIIPESAGKLQKGHMPLCGKKTPPCKGTDKNMDDTLYKITGEIENIVFRNDQNSYTVFEIILDNDMLTCVGYMPGVDAGTPVILYGKYREHPAYGLQFSVDSFEKTMPETVESIFNFLKNGAIKGIGESTAKKLIKRFGGRTLEIMENEPDRLTVIKGLTLEKAKDFQNQIKSKKSFTVFLNHMKDYKLEPNILTGIFRIYGDDSIDILSKNPYVICDDRIGATFDRAEMIAQDNDLPKDLSYRIRCGIIYILKHNLNNGHTCAPKNTLTELSSTFLSLDSPVIESHLSDMINDGSLYEYPLDDKDFIFLKDMFEAETYVAKEIRMMLNFKPPRIIDAENEIKLIERKEKIEYEQLQKDAIIKALEKNLLILTGGPGTGKTTTLNAIIKILMRNGSKVLLAAPTGRAAQRMTELTGRNAKTIHRLLEAAMVSNDTSMFTRNEYNKLKCDVLILDEASMIDIKLFEAVIKALPLGCKLILVGDSDQLPSVGPGNVLGDLISSGLIPCVKLTQIFRQALDSLIITNAHAIVSGEMPVLDVTDRDFFFLNSQNNNDISQTVVSLYTERLPQNMGFDPLSDIQIITPTRKTPLGTVELNHKIQSVINPKGENKKEIKVFQYTLRTGDKVMQNKNDYDVNWIDTSTGEVGKGIFNGDIGILKEIDRQNSKIKVQYDDKLAVYENEQIENLELAYVTTIHKSQGNEFNAVIIPVFHTTDLLMYRNLIYTGVTRAKNILILVGYKSALKKMIDNNKKQLRYTGLKYFLNS